MYRRLAVVGLLLGAIGSPVAAQAQVEPLQDMLGHVPEAALSSNGLVTYVDYRAVEAARPGAGTPRSYQAWNAMDSASFGQWMAAFDGVTSGSGAFLQAFPSTGEDWPTVMGFDFFDADRELYFGAPPEDGLIVAGRFQPPAIITAHEARGFTGTGEGDWTLICGAAGCEEGTAIDFEAREPADPFGGALGRQQPLLVSSDVLLSSAAIGVVRAMQDAGAGTTSSLAESPDVRAALDSLPADATLRQAALISPRVFVGDEALTGEPSSIEALPPYSMALFADTATATEQIAHVVLVFASSEDARAAAEVIPARIDGIESSYGSGPLGAQLEERGVMAVDVLVSEPEDGSGAAVDVVLRAPLAGAQASSSSVGSSSIYRLLMTTLFRRDALWLTPTLAEAG